MLIAFNAQHIVIVDWVHKTQPFCFDIIEEENDCLVSNLFGEWGQKNQQQHETY
jgi:hypothetical protein